jgi:hypothetical protein
MDLKPRTNTQVPVWGTSDEARSLLERVTFMGDKHRQVGGARQDLMQMTWAIRRSMYHNKNSGWKVSRKLA